MMKYSTICLKWHSYEFIVAQWRQMASYNLVIIGSGNYVLFQGPQTGVDLFLSQPL